MKTAKHFRFCVAKSLFYCESNNTIYEIETPVSTMVDYQQILKNASKMTGVEFVADFETINFVDLSDLTNSELKNILLSDAKVVAIWDSGNSQYDSGLSDELFRKLALIAAERL